MTMNASTLLKFANLQMASEARLDLFGGRATSEALVFGNNRSSRFTNVLATQFSQDWEVIAHQADTATGFSGTLFRCLRSDPTRGLVAGELAMSFRSTEFIDDAARDNQATNALEIQTFGWAFGQISDMRKWYESLLLTGKLLATDSFAVTGYSLGGHLATAFTQLLVDIGRADQISGTYTFNGAGVGELKSGTLSAALDMFDSHRDTSNESFFTSASARDVYARWRLALNADVDTVTRLQALSEVNSLRTSLSTNSQLNLVALRELGVLSDAISRSGIVYDEAKRVEAGLLVVAGVPARNGWMSLR